MESLFIAYITMGYLSSVLGISWYSVYQKKGAETSEEPVT